MTTQQPSMLLTLGAVLAGGATTRHAVAVEAWDGKEFVIADPLYGRYYQEADALAERLTGLGVGLRP
jgi:hypothetical protein